MKVSRPGPRGIALKEIPLPHREGGQRVRWPFPFPVVPSPPKPAGLSSLYIILSGRDLRIIMAMNTAG